MLGLALQKGNPDSGGSRLSSQEEEMVGRERVLYKSNRPGASEAATFFPLGEVEDGKGRGQNHLGDRGPLRAWPEFVVASNLYELGIFINSLL